MKKFISLYFISILSLIHSSSVFANQSKPSPEVLKLAQAAYDCAIASGVAKPQTLTVIDYSIPSNMERMWVLDMENNRTLFHTLVAHGKGSGEVKPTKFSNQPNSRATSLGLFKTAGTYQGSNGYSLRLIGLEPGYNDKAESRAVVMHGAPYVNQNIAKSGRIGRSWGCPAVPQQLAQPIINTIKGGNLVFAYYPENKWLNESKFLNCKKTVAVNEAVRVAQKG